MYRSTAFEARHRRERRQPPASRVVDRWPETTKTRELESHAWLLSRVDATRGTFSDYVVLNSPER